MSEMVERVARAIATGHGGQMTYIHPQKGMQTIASQRGYGNFGDSPEKYARNHWKDYEVAAQFAIAAMRIPLEIDPSPVYKAFAKAEPDGILGPAGLLAIWQAMIDEALK